MSHSITGWNLFSTQYFSCIILKMNTLEGILAILTALEFCIWSEIRKGRGILTNFHLDPIQIHFRIYAELLNFNPWRRSLSFQNLFPFL